MSRLLDLGALIESREARVGVVGLGYVGLPLALEFARAGFPVTGFDIDGEQPGELPLDFRVLPKVLKVRGIWGSAA